jgi:hypothetical protein
MTKTIENGSLAPIDKTPSINAKPISDSKISKTGKAENAPLSLTTGVFATYRGNGSFIITINWGDIHAGSSVMVSISEFSNPANPAGSRFIGAAKYAVNNVTPFDGGVKVWVDVSWPNPIYIYFDLLIN